MTFWFCLIRKVRLISKSMTSQTGEETIAIHILLNILRSKGNQAMKFGQLISYNMRNIFFEKSYTKCGRETIPRFFSKKSKLRIFLVLFVCQVEYYRKGLKLSCRPFAFTSYKVFFFKKKRSGTSLRPSFSTWFLKKSISVATF